MKKIVLYILIALASIGCVQSFVGIIKMPKEKNYYASYSYENRLIDRAGYVRDWIVRYTDETIFKEEGVTPEDIKRYREADSRVTSDEEAVEGILSDRRAYFELIQEQLVRRNVNVEYLAMNKATGEIISNSPLLEEKGKDKQVLEQVIEDFRNSPTLIAGNGEEVTQSILEDGLWNRTYPNYYRGSGVPFKDNYEIYVRTREPLKPGDVFYEHAINYEKRMATKNTVYTVSAVSWLVGLIGLAAWIKISGKKDEQGRVHLNAFDHIPFEVQSVGAIVIGFLWFRLVVNGLDYLLDSGWIPCSADFRIGVILVDLIIVAGVSLALACLTSFIKHLKNHSMSRFILVWRFGKWFVHVVITEKTLPMLALVTLIGGVFSEWVLLYWLVRSWGIRLFIVSVFFIGFNVIVVMGLVKVVVDYVKLSKGIETIIQGNLKPQVRLGFSLPIMQKTAQHINHIGEGLEAAVEKSVKSERLKTELITNVSHDLKTPLTSIISYIDLLKEEQIDNETAIEYIGILDERSHRLKQLVEDLVEASKAATGNVKSEIVPTQLDQLVIQAVGEYTDRLEASSLEVVFGQMEGANVLVDPRHMWRIIENLLSNACKYAMPNTRVYIDVLDKEEVGRLIIKNISKEPLHIDPNELTERFVRGASDRSTEGSGLGLAIATSLAQIQKGVLKLEIDGDLFKAIVEVPKGN